MSPTTLAVRTGLRRGWIEFRQSMTSGEDLGWYVVTGGIFLGILIWQRGGTVEGIDLSLAALSLPSMLGMLIAFSGLMGIAGALATQREDGTLLRAKAVPRGMIGYLSGLVLSTSLGTIMSMAIILVPGAFLVDGLTDNGITGWLTLLWVLVLGLLATLPWGAIYGSLFSNSRTVFGLGMLGSTALVVISGIFYPITALWGWLQAIGQVFPIYWLGLGMRSAFLPNSAAAVEIGESWRTAQTVGVLSIWAAAGLLLAPVVLRRMARKESGSYVEARRQMAMQRY